MKTKLVCEKADYKTVSTVCSHLYLNISMQVSMKSIIKKLLQSKKHTSSSKDLDK